MKTATEPTRMTSDPSRTSNSRKPGAVPVVVHVLHTVAYGGIETILINWLGTIDSSRVETHLVVFENPGNTEDAFVERAERAGISVRRIPWSRFKPAFRSSRALAEILDEVDADIVHTHNVYAEIVGYLAAKKRGCRVMNTLYVIADFGLKRNVQTWVSMRLIRRFDLVTSQCAATMHEAIRRGVPERIQKVLISGVIPLERAPAGARDEKRKELGAGVDDLVLVNVARLYPEKAQGLLLRAFKEIHADRPRTRLWILGVGPLEEELKDLCERLGLSESVRFLGFADALQDVLALCDIQVHPSHAEGVPLSICEGMRAGLPIVSSGVGGIPEMIEHQQSGLLIEAGDDRAFIRETLRLIDDESLRRTLGSGARTFIETDYSLETAVKQLTRTYEELAAR